MTADHWRRISELFNVAVARSPAERGALLAAGCGDDATLRGEVESLLAAHERGATFPSLAVVMDDSGRTRLDQPLPAGWRVGPYEIVDLLGVGGMGAVYRAKDTKLGRAVAIKVLLPAMASDPDRMARLTREARLLASLSHPHIAQVHGLEEADPSTGSGQAATRAIVMELVEGQTLADWIEQGALPVDEAVRIGRQIADALEAAHEQGIVHRDLKPANVKIRPDGTVKVLDFGLAKAVSGQSAGRDLLQPSTADATRDGHVVGTPAYMSPEHARGRAIDKRTDIWAFGCLLYEMLTGRAAFAAETTVDTIAAVLERDPDWSKLPASTPLALRRLLARCLDRDVRRRLRDIGEARLALEHVDSPATRRPGRDVLRGEVRPRTWLWPGVAGVLAALLAFAAWTSARSADPRPPLSVEFPVMPPANATFINVDGEGFSVSPDGGLMVFAAQTLNGSSSLWLRPMNSLTARPLPGTEGAIFTFWSPDSRSVAFSTRDGMLRRMDVGNARPEDDGAPLPLTELGFYSDTAVPASGSWSRTGVILIGSGNGLRRVSAAGGSVETVTTVDPARQEFGHTYPQFLPDGNRFLYFVLSADSDVQGIYASALDRPDERSLVLQTDTKALFVPAHGTAPDSLLWMRGDDLVAQPFDLTRLERRGEPMRVAENVARGNAPIFNQRAAYTVSEAGVLAYVPDDKGPELSWMSRDGSVLGDALADGVNIQPALSPDGTRMALTHRTAGGSTDIGVWHLDRHVFTRLSFDRAAEVTPAWSPDSRQLAYVAVGKGIYRIDASGAGQPELVLPSVLNSMFLLDWSPDGKTLLYRAEEGGKPRLWGLHVPQAGEPATAPFPVARSAFEQRSARFSPDGRWIAFTSTESGTLEAYIEPFVLPGTRTELRGRWRVSNTGSGTLTWRRDGQELYYIARPAGDIMTVQVRATGSSLEVGVPRLLFKAGGESLSFRSFDATPDGQKFIVVRRRQAHERFITVVTNWQALLGF